jgi:hypothetical protein
MANNEDNLLPQAGAANHNTHNMFNVKKLKPMFLSQKADISIIYGDNTKD